jgi:hypothetical protein
MRLSLRRCSLLVAIIAVAVCVAIRCVTVLPSVLFHHRFETEYGATLRATRAASARVGRMTDAMQPLLDFYAERIEHHRSMKAKCVTSILFFWLPAPKEEAESMLPTPPVPQTLP